MVTPPRALGVLARALAHQAGSQGRAILLEPEAGRLLHAAGFDVPYGVVADGPGDVPDLDAFPGDRVIVKLLAPEVTHRTDVDGIRVVPRESRAVVRAVEDILRSAADPRAQALLQEFIPHDKEPGGELLLSARWSREFGPLVTLALGGVTAEVWAMLCSDGRTFRVWSAHASVARVRRDLSEGALGSLLTGGLRNRAPRVRLEGIVDAVTRFLEMARAVLPQPLQEVEVNPLVCMDGRAVCLDGLVRLAPESSRGCTPEARPSKSDAMSKLLRPGTVALVGVSSRGMNPGRVILQNILASGFPVQDIQVVKKSQTVLDGCRCVPSLASLDPVDVLVVGVAAGEVPDVMETVAARGLARGVVLISGGLGEGGHGEDGARRLQELLDRDGAPGINGGNCLGIRSVPGRCNTLFIPPSKLGFPDVDPHPVALVSQSGAFAIARCSALPWLNPRYLITVGNQVDLTVGHWVEHLLDEPDLRVVACYVEGFQDGDGARFLAAARAHREAGRTVVLYRAGRTAQGAEAMASHTASLAGDYGATRALAEAEGVLVADSAQEFSDLLNLAVCLAHRRVDGTAVGLVSNAGFECVAMADGLGALVAPVLHGDTSARLREILASARLEGIVAPRNPLDVTPILGDAGFVAAVEAVLGDPGVDVGVVGCVPLTPALRTLPKESEGGADLEAEGGIVVGLARLWEGTEKAWVVSVDGGPGYDSMAVALQGSGIPVLRQADRAVDLLGRYVRSRLAQSPE